MTTIGKDVSRIEIIDKKQGRLAVLTGLPTPLEYDVQDDGRTLKIFVEIEDD